ncbi:MAG: RNA-binding protein [Granulosicoccus sp.]|nr:RNA-binding protein [Granulosicoccus sp.]
MKLLARNLDRDLSEENLKALFIQHGSVQSCHLVLDKETGLSKGFGFVEMPKAGEAKAAMKQLNGKNISGQVIRVKKAE